jgi:membrane-bound lytic murein transglycosylase D
MRVSVTIALLALPPWFASACATARPLPAASAAVSVADQPASTPSALPKESYLAQVSPRDERPSVVINLPASKVDEKSAAPIVPEPPAAEPAKPEQPSPTVLQEIHGPSADDKLVGLLQKEIEEAISQPSGRRKIQFSMTLVENERVRYFIDTFCGKLRDFFVQALARSGKYIPMMATVLQEAGLPEDLVYLSLIESGFSPSAYSRAKAVGPWQFIRATGVRYGLRIDNWVDERRDPVKSTRAAAAYLKDLHQQFGEWFLAAAAYNAGERRVETALQRSNTSDFWDLTERKTQLKLETRNYVPKFIAAALIAGEPEKYGFADLVYEAPVDYDEVTTRKPLTLTTVARLAQTTVTNIKELNPSLLRNTTPPSEEGFTLRLPSGSGEIFTQAYKNQYDSPNVKVISYTVKKGETLATIARRYHVRTAQIMEVNELKTAQLRAGQQLTIIQDGSPPAEPPPQKAAPQKTAPRTSTQSKTKSATR